MPLRIGNWLWLDLSYLCLSVANPPSNAESARDTHLTPGTTSPCRHSGSCRQTCSASATRSCERGQRKAQAETLIRVASLTIILSEKWGSWHPLVLRPTVVS
jgi:hypothetical protein